MPKIRQKAEEKRCLNCHKPYGTSKIQNPDFGTQSVANFSYFLPKGVEGPDADDERLLRTS